jgi:chromosome segregation ATPase
MIIEALKQKRKDRLNRMIEEEKGRLTTNLQKNNEQLSNEKKKVDSKLAEAAEKLQTAQQEINRLEILSSVDRQSHHDSLAEKEKQIEKLALKLQFHENELASISSTEKEYNARIKELRAENEELRTELSDIQVCLLVVPFSLSFLLILRMRRS